MDHRAEVEDQIGCVKCRKIKISLANVLVLQL